MRTSVMEALIINDYLHQDQMPSMEGSVAWLNIWI